MDVPRSFRPFFLTADHCGINADNAASVVTYWNFESPVCGQLSGGSLDQNQTGAILRSSRSDVDMALIELDAGPEQAFNVYFAGWDASEDVPQGSVGIHHPNGDEKAISFNDDPLTTTNSCIAGGAINTHWRVDNWEDGTTERGSSGSGLWNPNTRKLMGFLSGGLASCTNINFDCYGKFSVAWDGASATERLRDWLDPNNTGNLKIDGSEPDAVASFEVTATPIDAESCAPGSVEYNVLASSDNGFTDPVTLNVGNLPTGVSTQFAPNPITPGNQSILTVNTTAAALPDAYNLTIQGVSGQITAEQVVALNILEQTVTATALLVPLDNTESTSLSPTLDWSAQPQAISYRLEISNDATFNILVASVELNATRYELETTLTPNTAYYWRVWALGNCAEEVSSEIFRFTTTDRICSSPQFTIPDADKTGITDTLAINASGVIGNLKLALDISHDYVGDLVVSLSKIETANSVVLLDRPGNLATPLGCNRSDINVVLDDTATQPIENECAPSVPTISGNLSPANPLANFNGESLNGTWRLHISDHAIKDAGILNQWCLQPTISISSEENSIYKNDFDD